MNTAFQRFIPIGRRNDARYTKGKVHKSVKANRKFSLPNKRHTIKYDKTRGKIIVKKKTPVKLEKQKTQQQQQQIVQKKVPKLIDYYEKDQYLARIIIQFDQYTLLINQATEEYIDDLLDLCMTYMEFYRDDNNNNNKRIREFETEESKSRGTKSKEAQQEAQANKMQRVQGGANEECIKNIIWCLNYGVADSLHDFGKERNKYFPTVTSEKNHSYAFLEKVKDFLKPNYNQYGGNMDIEKIDKYLYPYYSTSPSAFEPIIKNNYLLGNICEKIENIYYFFNSDLPDNDDWNKIRKSIEQEQGGISSIGMFWDVLEEKAYEYCILDACMSIQTEPQWKKQIKKLRSLCNLWDPAGAEGFTANEFTDGDEELGLKLVFEKEIETGGKKYSLFDSRQRFAVAGRSEKSFYDVYSVLFNKYCLEKDGFEMYLRIGTEKMQGFVFENGILDIQSLKQQQPKRVFYVFLCITRNKKEDETKYFLIETGGFSVDVLSLGLYYIETGNDFPADFVSKNKEYASLKQVIDYLKPLLSGNENDKKNGLYNLLTRFKSTGDHGSALATKFLNEELKKPTLYLSGDQLAYVYSIANNIPTIFRFYSANKKGEKEDGNDEDQETCSTSRVHFIGASFPQLDEKLNCANKLSEIVRQAKKIKSDLGVGEGMINTMNKLEFMTNAIIRIKVELSETEDVAELNGKIRDFFDQVKGTFMDIYANMGILLEMISDISDEPPYNGVLLKQIKNIFNQLTEINHGLFYIKNYNTIRKIIVDVVKKQINDLSEVVQISADDVLSKITTKRGNSRFPGIQFSSLLPSSSSLKNMFTKMKSGFNYDSFVGELKSIPSNKDTKAKKGAQQQQQEQTLYDFMIAVKRKYFAKRTDVSESMKEQFGSSGNIMIAQAELVFEKYNKIIASKLAEGSESAEVASIGNFISRLFGIVKKPVIAEPIDSPQAIEVFADFIVKEMKEKEPILNRPDITLTVSKSAKKSDKTGFLKGAEKLIVKTGNVAKSVVGKTFNAVKSAVRKTSKVAKSVVGKTPNLVQGGGVRRRRKRTRKNRHKISS